MQTQAIQTQRYLPRCYYKQLQLQPCTVAIVHKKNASKVIQLLKNSPSVLQKQTHLKRIRKRQEENQFIQVMLCLQKEKEEKEYIISKISQFIIKLTVVDIPFYSPTTKQDYLIWSQHWPTIFVQQEIHKKIEHLKQEITLIQEIYKKDHQFILFVEDKQLYFLKTEHLCKQGTINHPIMNILKEWPNTQVFQQLPSAYYLTKLRLLCKAKICGMCAMALVHSRLERVYIQRQNLQEDIAQILTNEKLNHKIKIFLVQNFMLN